jgi:calcium-dependent protein kinase
LEQNLILRQ